jgi:hypothetical protein
MDGEEADICFTSPPYAQQRDYKSGPQDWDALMQGVFSILPVNHGAQVLVNLGLVHHDGEWLPYWDGWIEWMRAADWRRFGWYVWDKGFALPGDWNGRLAPAHEFLFHFNRATKYPRKTKQKKPENIGVRTSETATFRYPDGSTRKAHSPETAAMATQGGECVPFAADVTKEETLAAAMEAARARWGRIDILHNNVGVSIGGGDKPLDELSEEAFDRVCARRRPRGSSGSSR